MCGLAGLMVLNEHSEPPTRVLLQQMAQAIEHRGPDAEGYYVSPGIGLAHRRLSIIDIQSGQQPMEDTEAKLCIVYNGEVFNYLELKEELIGLGHIFKTHSDTEVVLKCYKQWGESFVEKLNGQFAIALWDGPKRSLILVRDRSGICPLFYSQHNGYFIFGSEVKAIKPALTTPLKISPAALDQIFTFWSPLGNQTIFESVKQVLPGEIILVADGAVSRRKYWRWEYSPSSLKHRTEESLAGELNELLHDSTRIRLRSDVPVGTYLSGGLDSSIITSIVHQLERQRLRAFSLNFCSESFDEKPFQDELISQFGLTHSNRLVSNDDIAKNFESSLYHIESPILRAAPVPMGLLSSHVHDQGYKVVLTGEGADEVFGGYDIFKEAKVRQFWAKQPDSKVRPLLLKKLYPYLNLPSTGTAEYLQKFFGVALHDPNNILFSHLPRWQSTARAKIFFSDSLNRTLEDGAIDEARKHYSPHISDLQPFNRSQFIESDGLMAGYLLSSQGDRMLAKNSVEGRYPFLDHRVIEFASQLPNSLKMKVLNEKYLLKKAMISHLPASIVKRPKQPFRSPDNTLVSTLAKSEILSHYLAEKTVDELGLFNSRKVARLQLKATKRPLNNSESQAFIGILSTQIIAHQYC